MPTENQTSNNENQTSSKTVLPWVKDITALLLAVSGLLVAIGQFPESLQNVGKVPVTIRWFIALVLLTLGLSALAWGRSRRSRLVVAGFPRLDQRDRNLLVGRDEDIEDLEALCRDYPLVHLVGESGAGKSALIQAGLLPRFKETRSMLPVYLGIWGQDWEKGPGTALCEAFWSSLSEEQREALGLTQPPDPERVLNEIAAIREKLAVSPLLIFDQFDDYQSRHQERFLPRRRRTWIPRERLVKDNAFWCGVKGLIDSDKTHCLFVTRAESADGLESVRFVEPRVYRLHRLKESLVPALLERLTTATEGKEPIIVDPDNGWNRLKLRLARDLTGAAGVLPIQMSLALQGLSSLPRLTVGAYERSGGLTGLDAGLIVQHVKNIVHDLKNAAELLPLTESQVRALLLAMVDAENRPVKTVPRHRRELERIVVNGGNTEADPRSLESSVAVALDELESKGIIRKRINPDTRQQDWVLDHDYRCHGVLEAERRANLSSTLLEDGRREFENAGHNLGRAWRALLNPWQQILLFIKCLRGEVRYGESRLYALWSLARWAPYALALTLGLFAYGEYRSAQHRRLAEEIFAGLTGHPGALTDGDVALLWTLCTSPREVRRHLLELTISGGPRAERLATRDDYYGIASPGMERLLVRIDAVVHASVGDDERFRNEYFSESARKLVALKDQSAERLYLGIARELAATDPELLKRLCLAIRSLMMETGDEVRLAERSATMANVPCDCSDSNSQLIADRVAALMRSKTDPWTLRVFAQSLGPVAAMLPEASAVATAEHIAALMRSETNPSSLSALSEALGPVAAKLPRASAAATAEHIAALMRSETNSGRLFYLAPVLRPVAASAPEAVAAVANHILKLMRSDPDRMALGSYGSAAAMLTPEAAVAVVEHMLALMRPETDSFVLQHLSMMRNSISMMRPGVDDATQASAAAVAERIAARMLTENVPERLAQLGSTLENVKASASKATAAATAEHILELMRSETNPGNLAQFGSAVHRVYHGPVPSSEALNDTVLHILNLVRRRRSDYFAVANLEHAIRSIAEPSAEAARAVAKHAAGLMRSETNPGSLFAYATELQGMAPQIPSSSKILYSKIILSKIRDTGRPDLQISLLDSWATLGTVIGAQDLLDLLKWPHCVGSFRLKVIELLGKHAGEDFGGNYRKALEWARGAGLNLGPLREPPQFTTKGTEEE
jgi:hypothetical protein